MPNNCLARAKILSPIVAALMFFLTTPCRAEFEYCAQRKSLYECFPTLAEAELFIRSEPVDPIGARFLQPLSVQLLSLTKTKIEYGVTRKAVEALVTLSHTGIPISPGGAPTYNCNRSIQIPGVIASGCETEDDLATQLNQEHYEGRCTMVYSGSYDSPPADWGPVGEPLETWGRRHVSATVNRLNTRTLDAVYPSGTRQANQVSRTEYFICPEMHGGISKTDVRAPTWPEVCGNSLTASITITNRQYQACTRGNPCVVATGNKEYRTTDFVWEGVPFVRTYNSLGELVIRSGLTRNWAHTFSDSLVMGSNSRPQERLWIQGNGYFEIFSKISSETTRYRSRNATGHVLYENDGPEIGPSAPWTLVTSDGRILKFDASGRLIFARISGRDFTMVRCDEGGYAAGSCAFPGALSSVLSQTGRRLNMAYTRIPVTLASDTPTIIMESRLTAVLADDQKLVTYRYDELDRLISRLLENEPVTSEEKYLYGEPENVCRANPDEPTAECKPSNSYSLLTGVINADGIRASTYRYDATGRVLASILGNDTSTLKIQYLSECEVQVTGPTQASERFTLLCGDSNAFRKPTEIIQYEASGQSVGSHQQQYDDYMPTVSTDRLGTKTKRQFDGYSREITRIEDYRADGTISPETRTTETVWDNKLNMASATRIRDRSGALIHERTTVHNTRGQITENKELDPITGRSRTTTYTYCEAADVAAGTCPQVGLLVGIDGPRTDVADITRLTYFMADAPGCSIPDGACIYRKADLLSVVNPVGHARTFQAYDALGNPTSINDDAKRLIETTYSKTGDVLSQRVTGANPSGTGSPLTELHLFVYYPSGLLREITRPDGRILEFSYDDARRLQNTKDGAGNSVTYTLDALGNHREETVRGANGLTERTITRTFDWRGNVLSTTGIP
jgi:YD repeat-containing protein